MLRSETFRVRRRAPPVGRRRLERRQPMLRHRTMPRRRLRRDARPSRGLGLLGLRCRRRGRRRDARSWWPRRATPRARSRAAMIALVLETPGPPGRAPARARADPDRPQRRCLSGEVDDLSRIHRQRRLLHRHGERPGLEAPQGAYDADRARLDAARGLVWLDRAPANNTWLIAVNGATSPGASAWPRWRTSPAPCGRGADPARRLHRVRGEPRGAAGLRGGLRLHPAAGPHRQPARRRHGGDGAGGRAGDQRRQRRHGLRHRRGARAPSTSS